MIIGTAGHIDHGKTALVRALTGVDTDRLPEEKRRGITIALGFAALDLPGVGRVGVVDVPGHEAFVRTMLAGASGVDCALLVVAADEGVMPQTREHLDILHLLGVRRAVVALSKADLADDELRTLVTLDVQELLSRTALADSVIVPVSAVTGAGVDALRAALSTALAEVPQRDADLPWRMPVDRVFSVAGAGTVATGTSWSGRIAAGASVRVLPAGHTARVRSVESHGSSVDGAAPGARTAVALAGLDREEVQPGDTLVNATDVWRSSRVLRADIALLPAAAPLGVRSRVHFHLGTQDCPARVVAVGGRVEPGQRVPVRVVLESDVVARAGDRFVLRGGSPLATIGGGIVTDPLPAGLRAKPWAATDLAPKERLALLLEDAGAAGLPLAELPQRLGLAEAEIERLLKTVKGTARVADRLVSSALLDDLRATLLAAVEAQHRDAPLAPGLALQAARAALSQHEALADEVIRRAERAGLVEVQGSAIRRPGWDPAAAQSAGDRLEQLQQHLEQVGVEPPSVAELQAEFGSDVPALLKLLEQRGAAVPVSVERWFAASAVRELLARLRQRSQPDKRYAPSELREFLGISRKYLIPFLEWCDRKGIAHRNDDGRRFPDIPESA